MVSSFLVDQLNKTSAQFNLQMQFYFFLMKVIVRVTALTDF